MKIWKIAVISALAVSLGLGAALPVLAATNDTAQVELKPGDRILRGKVASVGESSFTIKSDNQTIAIRGNEGTKYYIVRTPPKLIAQNQLRINQPELNQAPIKATALTAVKNGKALGRQKPWSDNESAPKFKAKDQLPPGLNKEKGFVRQVPRSDNNTPKQNMMPPFQDREGLKELMKNRNWLRKLGKEATFNDIVVGDMVVVWTASTENEPLAKVVLIIKAPAVNRIAGTITGVDEVNRIITLQTENNTLTFAYDNSTVFVLHGTPSLKPGDKAVIVYVEQAGGLLARRVTATLELPQPTTSA